MPGRPVHTFEVLRTEHITSHMIRVMLGGNGFDTFAPSEFTDSYVKLIFVDDDVDVAGLPQPLTLDSFSELPAAKRPVVRTITVRRADAAARELTVDIAVHGDHGAAGPWAAKATRPNRRSTWAWSGFSISAVDCTPSVRLAALRACRRTPPPLGCFATRGRRVFALADGRAAALLQRSSANVMSGPVRWPRGCAASGRAHAVAAWTGRGQAWPRCGCRWARRSASWAFSQAKPAPLFVRFHHPLPPLSHTGCWMAWG